LGSTSQKADYSFTSKGYDAARYDTERRAAAVYHTDPDGHAAKLKELGLG
jgi:hypothetical protein